MSDINDLIQSALDQDYNKANQVFGDLMGEKISDALDQQKANIAAQIYNGVEPAEDETEFEAEVDDLNDEEIEDMIDDEDLDIEDETEE